MTVLKPKVRQVSFRISDDEYALMLNLCSAFGARSASDLARLAVLRLAEQCGNAPEVQADAYMRSVELRLAELNRRVDVLSRLVKVSSPRRARERATPGSSV